MSKLAGVTSEVSDDLPETHLVACNKRAVFIVPFFEALGDPFIGVTLGLIGCVAGDLLGGIRGKKGKKSI